MRSDVDPAVAPEAGHGFRAPTFALLLNAPRPPSLWKELSGSLRGAFLPELGNTTTLPYSFSKWILSILHGLFPVLDWGTTYSLSSFKSDLMAGLTLASLGIPQSIGYANLAKLEPEYGLYTSLVPPLIYAVMGTSRDIAIGPVAVISLLLSSMAQKTVDPAADPAGYRRLVLTSTFFAGVFQTSFGFFRLGFMVDFLSHATIVGFMGAAAIVIGMQQLKGLLGLKHFTNSTDVVSVIKAVWLALRHHSGTKRKRYFWLAAIGPLLSVILSTLMVYLTRADRHGVRIIQGVKKGLNPSSIEQIELSGGALVGDAAKIGLICAIIALTEAVAVGRSFAAVKGYQLDGNKEMVAMGFMNIAGSCSSCYVATGGWLLLHRSFSRTAVNARAGCKTTVSNVVMAIAVLVSLELLTRLLYYTPVAVLASIILSALPGLVDVKEACNIWRVDKMDFLACIGAFLGVLFGSVEIGLLAAVIISFAKITIGALRPSIEMLGRVQGTDVFLSVRQYPSAIKTPNLLIIRIDSPFFCFMNANLIRERIIGWATEKGAGKIKAVVIDMSKVMSIDTSGLAAIKEILKKLPSSNVQVGVVNPGWQVINKMKLAGIVDENAGSWMFLSVSEAVEACDVAMNDVKEGAFSV
ncbi:hypothetical protein ZIOFF_049232 [Zingiber officinale]|uniref:STAS domain-containing protein n=1 Tax=Zingiber officinale TaxID=94328 RepID=A0A8J5FSG0_ZINOF|nr:hypothetical protein ZIOFF_049232 [Zingiber officinale]